METFAIIPARTATAQLQAPRHAAAGYEAVLAPDGTFIIFDLAEDVPVALGLAAQAVGPMLERLIAARVPSAYAVSSGRP